MQSNNKNFNPCFCEEAGAYLEEHGFVRSDRKLINDAIYFFKKDVGVIIYGDNADFILQHKDEHSQSGGEYKRFSAHTGIATLTLFDWMLLLHITRVITLKTFIDAVKKEDPGVTTANMLAGLFNHFKVTDNKEALPLGY